MIDMDTNDIRQLLDWLDGPRDMTEGAALYRRFGTNLMLKRQFAVDRSPMARAMLENEIRKLAGIPEHEMRTMTRRAAQPAVTVAAASGAPAAPREVPPEEKRKIRFRERFPFLGADNCPEVLKVLVADLFTAYGRFRESFEALQRGDARIMAQECGSAVENYLEDRMILDELTHYRDTGTLLGAHPKVRAVLRPDLDEPDYMAMDVADLVKKLNSAQTNVSKASAAVRKAESEEKRAAAEERLEKWKIRLETIRAAVELRKKN